MSSTSTDAVIIQAVSPLLGTGGVGACANADAAARQNNDAVIAVAAIRREVPTVMRSASKSLRRIELVAGERFRSRCRRSHLCGCGPYGRLRRRKFFLFRLC